MPKDAMEPAVVLGQSAAETLKKKVGDTLQLETKELTVVGIVDGGALVENGSVILSLPLFQEITGNQDKINIVDVRAAPSMSEDDIKRLCVEINSAVPEARAMLAGEHIGNSEAYRFIRAMSWGTSLLAVIVGVLGVMNTMLMTVFERKQEICILLAIGWKQDPHYSHGPARVGDARIARRNIGSLVWIRRSQDSGNHAGHPRTAGAGFERGTHADFGGDCSRRRSRQRAVSGLAQLAVDAQPGAARLKMNRKAER